LRVHGPDTGGSFNSKRRRRHDEPGQARELTFSCYHFSPFLSRDRTRQWFVEALQDARRTWPVDLWAYVLMPEHVHLLVCPRESGPVVSGFLRDVKKPVARRGIEHLKSHAPEWLPRITVVEAGRVRRRFWQPGGGYDRNIMEISTLIKAIDYIHANPVRRGLVGRPVDWEWSSARWFEGIQPVPIEMDRTLPMASDNAP
jgi:putative transposase